MKAPEVGLAMLVEQNYIKDQEMASKSVFVALRRGGQRLLFVGSLQGLFGALLPHSITA